MTSSRPTTHTGDDLNNGSTSATASPPWTLALLNPGGSSQYSALDWEATPSERRRHDIRILIVDDTTLYRETLAAALAANDSAAAPTVAWDLQSLQSAIEECTPDIVLLSMSTRDSATLLRTTTTSRPGAKVIAVGVSVDDEATIVACAEAGVTGYHLNSESLEDLLVLLGKVTRGDSACPPRVAAILLNRLSMLAAERKPGVEEVALTERETQILRMLEMGLTNRDIAHQLCIALHTVKNHVHSVLGKFGVSTRAQAVAVSRSFQSTSKAPHRTGTETAEHIAVEIEAERPGSC
jgi:DNA-binding NarL/FixJ family response regulator